MASYVLAFWLIFDMDHYLPWVVAIGLIPTGLGIAIVWWHVHVLAAVGVLIALGFRTVEIARGVREI